MPVRDELPTNPATPSVLPQKIRLGIDVSHHQNPSEIDWVTLRKNHSFCIVRLAYGALPDLRCLEHVSHARNVGLAIGGYLFFRSTQTVEKQLECFARQARRCGIGTGWIVPCLDIEDDPGSPPNEVKPNWGGQIRRILSTWHGVYGAPPLVYCSHRDWQRLGSPAWLLGHPLWVPHWNAKKPRVPGDIKPKIWQRKVAPLPGVYARDIDQNVAFGALPRIPTITPRGRRQIESVTALTIDETARRK